MRAKPQMRRGRIERVTKETRVTVRLTREGSGASKIATGVPFLDHMLELFAKHGLFALEINCRGDLHIDDHHSVEDVAICLAQAFSEAIGDKKVSGRCGLALVPRDRAA